MSGMPLNNEIGQMQGSSTLANFWNLNQVISLSGVCTISRIEEMIKILKMERLPLDEQIN